MNYIYIYIYREVIIWLTQALQLLFDGGVHTFGVTNVALHQALLGNELAREGLAQSKDCCLPRRRKASGL